MLGQTGLWGSLMGTRGNTKTVEEETESTDGEDEDIGMIDSEGPNKCADRKAALRRQQQILREDIENLEARAVLQVGRDVVTPNGNGFFLSLSWLLFLSLWGEFSRTVGI